MSGRGLLVLVVACASAGFAAPAPGGTASVPHWPVWLCLPAAEHDWCHAHLDTEIIDARGKHTAFVPTIPANRPIDCFYVYPSVSLESRGNSDLKVTDQEAGVAVGEAAPFEQACDVFAPMYHQVTAHGDLYKNHSYELEYTDVRAAWHDYLAHYNNGRGVVLIGHSEGAGLLKRLIREEIQPSSDERKLLVSAILAGGDVVAANSGSGGDMPGTPPCTSRTQTGCYVAWSTFMTTPPKASGFEGNGSPTTTHVVCVNPADPGATGAVPVTPWFPTFDSGGVAPLDYGAKWFWVEFPQMYTARCVRQGGRSWLLVRHLPIVGDKRPLAAAVDGPDWGLHEADLTVTLPELVALVKTESAAYQASHP